MQTIWLQPRTTSFTEVCVECEHELRDGLPWATVMGSLPLELDAGWVTCARGHTLPVRRIAHVTRTTAAA